MLICPNSTAMAVLIPGPATWTVSGGGEETFMPPAWKVSIRSRIRSAAAMPQSVVLSSCSDLTVCISRSGGTAEGI